MACQPPLIGSTAGLDSSALFHQPRFDFSAPDVIERMLCTDCQSGYRAPYDRFERLAANPAVPSFLMRCKQCAALWNESSGEPELLTRIHARGLYPDARI